MTGDPEDEAADVSARAMIHRVLGQRARAALAAGSSVIADATFREDPARAAIEGAAGDRPFLGLWLRAEACQRLGRTLRRGGQAAGAAAKVALEQVEPARLGHGWRTLDAGKPAARLVQDVQNLLAQKPA